jgi:predicted ester cyclase
MRVPTRRRDDAHAKRTAFRRKTMIKTLSTEERVAIARDYLARVFNGANAERAREFFTKDVVWHGGALGTVTGVDTIVPILGGFIGALTGIKSEVQDVIASNDLVALRLVVSATHTGNLLGIPATGRRIQWDAVDIYRVRDDGKISEQWAFEDMAAILSQTGAAKLPWAG